MLKTIFILILLFILAILLMAAYFAIRFWTMLQAVVKGNKQTNVHAKFTGNEDYKSSSQTNNATSSSSNKKIFAADEGEYVEFEEVP